MWEQVVRLAGADAGAGRGTGRVIERLGARRVIYTQSWPYDDPAGRLAARLGCSPANQQYTGIGGTRPLQKVMELTDAIERGRLVVGCVVGAEALATVRRLKKAGERPAWLTFACWDIGRRARMGRSPKECVELIGATMAPLSSVAVANPELRSPHPPSRRRPWASTTSPTSTSTPASRRRCTMAPMHWASSRLTVEASPSPAVSRTSAAMGRTTSPIRSPRWLRYCAMIRGRSASRRELGCT